MERRNRKESDMKPIKEINRFRLRIFGMAILMGICCASPVFAQRSKQSGASRFTGKINGHEYVDLGLPSGLKWAACNVGADSPEAHGSYFAWGETVPKESYTYETCRTVDRNIGDISGKPQYDAAAAVWGNPWRLPTKEEFAELKNACRWTWEKHNGHQGYRITGPNGNAIFLPAAGYVLDDYTASADTHGYYTTATIDPEALERAWGLGFISSGVFFGNWLRECGQPVRAVAR